MNVEQFNKENKLNLELLISKIINKVVNLKEVAKLKQLVPSLNNIIIGYGWSGFNDGDAEYPIIQGLFNFDIDCDYDIGVIDDLDDIRYRCVNGDGFEVFQHVKFGKRFVYELSKLTKSDKTRFCKLYEDISDALIFVVENTKEVGELLTIKIGKNLNKNGKFVNSVYVKNKIN